MKEDVTDSGGFLEPIRERREKITDDDVIDVLRDGCRRANVVAVQTLWMAKQAAKYDFFEREVVIR